MESEKPGLGAKRLLKTRSDIYYLVEKFYDHVRQDDVLGPIFNRHIPEDSWPEHLEKLTDFWESNLLGNPKFKGNPTLKHIEVDKHNEKPIEQQMFGRWLQHWFKTIDDNFEGEQANKAKEAARRMAHMQFMMIWKGREV